jgi:HD-GYP domain-containing protein (c-di-GMP phosphodiesterase class II)
MTEARILLCGASKKLEGLQWESDHRLRVGRMDSMEILLSDPSVSRRHAEIFVTPEGWVIQDLGSKNGTFINGIRVGRSVQRVHVNDVLQFGDMYLTVKILEEATVTAHPSLGSDAEKAHIKTSGAYVRLEAVTSHTWEEALQALGRPATSGEGPDGRFLTLLRAGYHLCHLDSLDDLLQSVLQETVAALNSQRGAILLMSETSRQLELRAAACSPSSPEPDGRCYSRILADRCFRKDQSILCRDVNTDLELRRTGSCKRGSMASVICALLRSPRRRLGVIHLDRGTGQEQFTEEEFYLADAIAASVSTGIECAQLVSQQREQSLHMVTALAQAVELRDQYTGGHTQRVTTYALFLAEELKLSPQDQHLLRIGTPLHDIGKIGINDAILQKPGRLTIPEFEHMKLHTVQGARILETIPDFSTLIPIVRHHHERWNGMGYPDGLASDGISPLARVVAVADTFDAMTSDRPYRPALSVEQAYGELMAQAGHHFDPQYVEAFCRLRPRLEAYLAQEDQVQRNSGTLIRTFSPKELERVALV